MFPAIHIILLIFLAISTKTEGQYLDLSFTVPTSITSPSVAVHFNNISKPTSYFVDIKNVIDAVNAKSDQMWMISLSSTAEVRIQLTTGYEMIMESAKPRKIEQWLFDGPWISYMKKMVDANKIFHVVIIARAPATGSVVFSAIPAIRKQFNDHSEEHYSIPVDQNTMFGTYPVAIDHMMNAHLQENRSLVMTTYLTYKVEIGITKCELSPPVWLKLPNVSHTVFTREMLEHKQRMSNVYCSNDRNADLWYIVLKTQEHVTGRIVFEFDKSQEQLMAGLFFILIAVSSLVVLVFIVYYLKSRKRVKKKEMFGVSYWANQLDNTITFYDIEYFTGGMEVNEHLEEEEAAEQPLLSHDELKDEAAQEDRRSNHSEDKKGPKQNEQDPNQDEQSLKEDEEISDEDQKGPEENEEDLNESEEDPKENEKDPKESEEDEHVQEKNDKPEEKVENVTKEEEEDNEMDLGTAPQDKESDDKEETEGDLRVGTLIDIEPDRGYDAKDLINLYVFL